MNNVIQLPEQRKDQRVKVFPYYLFKVVYFDLQYLNTKSIFVGRQRKTSIRKNIFPDYREYQIRQQGFPRGRLRWDSLSAFGASLHPTLLAISAKQSFALPGKINQLHPICVGDYTLELISN